MREVKGNTDVDALGQSWGVTNETGKNARKAIPDQVRGEPKKTNNKRPPPEPPRILSVDELLAMDLPKPEMLVADFLPLSGACLLVGAPKSNKTLIAIQTAIAVASGNALFNFYRVLSPGSVLFIEQDDPAGASSMKEIFERSPISVKGKPLFMCPRLPLTFGSGFIDWLKREIIDHKHRLVVLDSYTALRPSRGAGVDIVKVEQAELAMLDELAKETACTIIVIHHDSKGSSNLDWSQKAAGTYAMGAATEAQIHTSRFPDLPSNAPERLVRIRGRHLGDKEMVLRFREATLDHEHVLEGGGAPLYPLIVQIESSFGKAVFTPKELCAATGVSRATAHRQLDRLSLSNVLKKRGFGEYALDLKL
jgi:hypothetical protein